MKKKFSALIIGLLLAASMKTLPGPVYASNSISVVPSTAYVGMFRTIFIYVSASDTATGIWETGVWADVSTVPAGIWIDFDPAFVRFSSSIEFRMLVYAGPAASPGTYSITIKAGWTTIIGQHWETQTTFTLQVETVSERYWAQNPSLLLQNPPNPTPADKWHPGVRQWVPPNGPGWEVGNTENLYANWNVSGRVDMMAKAVECNNIDQVAHFIQGLPEGTYQPPPVTLNPQKTQINLKGAVTGIFTSFPDDPRSWTGIKWDLWATSTKDGRTLYIELYFVRTGGNLLWELIPPIGFNVHPEHNEVLKLGDTWDNALLAITESSMSFNQAYVSIVTLDPTTWFSIDVTGIFGIVAYEYATFFPEVWDSSRSINDYDLTQVALCLEANNGGGSVTPQCSISLEDFELKGSYLADINLDGKIDNTDVTTVNNALNSALGDSSYLPNADLNLDRIIDSTDLAMVTNYVGKTFPAPWLTVSSTAGGTTDVQSESEYYNIGDDSASLPYGVNWATQIFTVGNTAHTVTSVKLKMNRMGNPGILTVSIRATDVNEHPTGSDLTSGTINANDFTGYLWYQINLTSYVLQANTKYAIVCRALSGTSSNYIVWGMDITSPTYANGCYEYSSNSGSSWTTNAQCDLMFEVWGSGGTGPYNEGQIVAITAIPDSGCAFECWLLDGAIAYNNPISITMESDHALKAHFSKPLCAMKTGTSGYFYVPNLAPSLLKVEMLFNTQNLFGDQTGGASPYSTIQRYPDRKVDLKDVYFVDMVYGQSEGGPEWDYMADVVPDRKCDLKDYYAVCRNYGNSGTYITDLSGVTVKFNTGEEEPLDSYGFVTIPQGATTFGIYKNGNAIGALITFW